MIIEQRTYTLAPGNMSRYWEEYERHGLAALEPALPHLIGYFVTDIGPLNQVVHIWKYDSYQQRAEVRGALAADPRWQGHLARIRPLMVAQESKTMVPAPVPGLAPVLDGDRSSGSGDR
jgi:hypothetical protein